MVQLVSVGSDELGVVAVGQVATGIFAFGQIATGVIAIGQVATGVIAIGQVARGVVAIGQGALGIVAAGMLCVGVAWGVGLGVAGTSGLGGVYGLLGTVRPRRILALARREPWDATPHWPAWRVAGGMAGFLVLVAVWWFAAGQAALATLR
jgi:hypothetical protein